MTDLITYLRSKPLDLKLQAAADRLEELEEELHTWQSVFPDIIPENLKPLPDNTKPDWEGFGMSCMASWPQGDLEGSELQDIAVLHGVLIPVVGGFNPEIHCDEYGYGAQKGDLWFAPNYDDPPSPPTGEQEHE